MAVEPAVDFSFSATDITMSDEGIARVARQYLDVYGDHAAEAIKADLDRALEMNRTAPDREKIVEACKIRLPVSYTVHAGTHGPGFTMQAEPAEPDPKAD